MKCRFEVRVRQGLCALFVFGCVAAVRAGNPPSGQGYIMLGQDLNSPTPCVDKNADSLSISEANVGAAVWQAVQKSGYYNWGYFGSSMTAPTADFYSKFPTMRRWYSFDVGASQSAAERAPYCPPNENYDYWVGGSDLCTPNDGSVDTHYGANHVYKFNGRSLTIDGIVNHCSKGTSICDFGTNVTLKSGNYQFPALGTHSQIALRMKAKVEGTFGFLASSGMGNNQKACYVDVALTGEADKTVLLKQGASYSATWYWCGDCSAYAGKLRVSGTDASPSCFTILAVSNVVCGGTVEVEAIQRLQMYGANAFVENVDIRPGAYFDVTGDHISRVGTLTLSGQLDYQAAGSRLVVTDAFSASPTCSILLGPGVVGELLTIPSASTFTAEDFVAAVVRGGGCEVCVASFRDNGNDTKTLVVSSPSSVASRTVDVTQDAVIGVADEKVRVNVASGATLTLSGNIGTRMPVNSDGGTITIKWLFDDWATPSLWLDASATAFVSNVVTVYENSYLGYDSTKRLRQDETFCDEDGNPFILGWFDCRGEKSVKLWNSRYDALFNGNHNVMAGAHPRCVLGGLNGLDYIACDRPTPSLRAVYADNTTEVVVAKPSNLARIYFTNYATAPTADTDCPQTPRYAFFVYGSAGGGGGALMGGNANFLRGGTVGSHTKDDPIFASNTKNARVWLDGTEVDPTTSGFNGAWQVVTVDYRNNDNKFSGLGYGSNNASDNGGQAYAEVILVNEELTDRQRQTIEIYLAEKWGLASQYAYPEWVKKSFATVYGTGTVNLKADATLGGSFAGMINLGGRNLTIDGTNLPPTEAAINTANLEGWYDPDAEGKTTTGVASTEYYTSDGVKHFQEKTPSPRMFNLVDKVREPMEGDALVYGQPSRAPWLNAEPRGFGPVRKWMDFSNSMEPIATNISNGCVLRFSHFMANLTSDGQTYQQPMQTLFFVQDSVHGGGHPFADGVNVNSPVLYKSRTQTRAAVGQPIYPSGSDGVLTAGLTCLDGREVDGLAESFGARPEVVTVVPTNTFNLVAFGQIGNSENIQGGTTELLGEIMIYNRKLDEPERRVVEAYLSHKWLGIEQAGYSSLTEATVTGAGTVTARSAALLPKFDMYFSGTVNLPLTDGLDFTLVTENATTTVVDAHDFSGGTLAATGDVTVRVATNGRKPRPGSYMLLGWGTKPAATWSLEKVGWDRGRCTLRATDAGLYLDIGRSGFAIIYR